MLQADQLVVLESTTYPSTTRERVLPLLEESGLAAGRDFHLAFSPERVDPGRTDYTLRNTPKVIGGLTLIVTAHPEVDHQKVAQRARLVLDLRGITRSGTPATNIVRL